jgi:hypothetical protein
MRALQDSTEKIQCTIEGKTVPDKSASRAAIKGPPQLPIDTGGDVVLPGGKKIKILASW